MATPLPNWLRVNPQDYLAASQAGANVGLSIARLRQAADDRNLRLRADSEEKAADRQAASDRLRQQLAQQRESKLADMELARERESQDLLQSQAGLDFRKAQEDFQKEQQGLKLRGQADVAGQHAAFLSGLAEAVNDPDKMLALSKQFPLDPNSTQVAQLAIRMKQSNQVRTETANRPKAEDLINVPVPLEIQSKGSRLGMNAPETLTLKMPQSDPYVAKMLGSNAPPSLRGTNAPPVEAAQNPLPMPKTKAELKKGLPYITSRGVAVWDGENFVQ